MSYKQFANLTSEYVCILKSEKYGEYRYEYINDQAMQQFQEFGDDVTNLKVEEVLSSYEAQFLIKKYNDTYINQATTVFNQHKGGIVYETKLTPFMDVEGRVTHLVMMMRDITVEHKADLHLEKTKKELYHHIKENEKALMASKERYKCLVKYNKDAVFEMNLDGMYLHANPAIEEVTGYNAEELKGNTFHSIVAVKDIDKVVYFFNEARKGKAQSYECTCVDKNNKYISLDVKNIPIYINNEIIGIFGIAKNITPQKLQERKIKLLAYNDPLTLLPNKALLDDRINQSILETRKQKNLMALLYVDLDGFKNVNDYLGHSIGDQLLIEASQRISRCLENRQTLARIGGDEFVILLSDVLNKEAGVNCAKKIIEVLKEPFELHEVSFQLTCSIGVTYYDGSKAVTGEELLKQADLAMYHIKKRGKNNVVVYNEEMNINIKRKITLETDMRKAIKDGDFYLEYQPIVHTKTKKTISAEVLIRWNHKSLGRIPPNQFIPIAEETGLIIPIGEWVFRTACLQLKKWQQEYFETFRISINVSVRQLQEQKRFIETIKTILKETGVAAKDINIEITETLFMENYEELSQMIHQLYSLGLHISMDDFGTGYSSMSILKNLPIHTIKIDRSFIDDVEVGSRNRALINSIIKLAERLDMQTVGEGVENEKQLAILAEENCDYVQGFHICRPVSAEEFILQNFKEGL